MSKCDLIVKSFFKYLHREGGFQVVDEFVSEFFPDWDWYGCPNCEGYTPCWKAKSGEWYCVLCFEPFSRMSIEGY